MSTQSSKLSLFSVVIININIMLGTGIFINTTELASRAGLLGGLSYGIVGLLLFPLILSFVTLLQIYPNGGFYSFCSASIHPIAGFINTWGYFVSKLSSATLAIHIFVMLIQKIFPVIAHLNSFTLDCLFLLLLLALNMLNFRTGSKIQSWIMILKVFPVFFVIIIGLLFLQGTNLTSVHQLWEGLPSSIPLVLHALLGFEVACAISRNLENPQVNGPRSILISYATVIGLAILYQTLFYGSLGITLAHQIDYRGAFPLLINKLNISIYLQNFLVHFIHLAIAVSALSASFGIIYANMWNLYSLAELNHTFVPALIMRRNRFNIPFMCVLAQGIIMFTYMVIINGEQITFQQLSAFGATITYITSIAGLMATQLKNNNSILIPVLGLINCAILLFASLYTMWITNNPIPLLLFSGIMMCGIIMYALSGKKDNNFA